MGYLNKVMIIGNVGKDPEIKYTAGGDAVCNLSIATTKKWTDKSGEKQEKTEWHRISMFGRIAEIAGEYVKKGSSIYVEGELQTRKWTDKENVERYTTEIRAFALQLLGGKRDDEERGEPETENKSASRPTKADPEPTGLDDDIPF